MIIRVDIIQDANMLLSTNSVTVNPSFYEDGCQVLRRGNRIGTLANVKVDRLCMDLIDHVRHYMYYYRDVHYVDYVDYIFYAFGYHFGHLHVAFHDR